MRDTKTRRIDRTRARGRWMHTCSTRWRRARHGGLCTSRTRAATARPARVPSPRTNRLGPPRGDATSHPRSIASTDTSSPACRSSPRCPGGSTATARGFANASSSRSWLAAVCCSLGRPGAWVSPIHVHDCARALVHLAEHGEAGGRYFLVNSDPIRMHEFAGTFARLANRPLRVWRVPAAATRLVVGPVLADDLLADAVFSNIRLRGIGFRFRVSHARAGTPANPRSTP